MKKQLLIITVASLTAFVAQADFFSDLKKKVKKVVQNPKVVEIRKQIQKTINSDPHLKAAAASLKTRATLASKEVQAIAEQQAKRHIAKLGKQVEKLTPEQVKQVYEQVKNDEAVKLVAEAAKIQARGAKGAAREVARQQAGSLKKTIFG